MKTVKLQLEPKAAPRLRLPKAAQPQGLQAFIIRLLNDLTDHAMGKPINPARLVSSKAVINGLLSEIEEPSWPSEDDDASQDELDDDDR